MWGLLAAAVLVLLLFMYIPGYLLLRGLGTPRFSAVAFAPPVAIVGYSVLAVIYRPLGLACSWATLVIPLVVAAGAVFTAGLLRNRLRLRQVHDSSGSDCSYDRIRTHSDDARSFFAYLAAGVIAAIALYVAPLGEPDAFVCGNDLAHHLNIARSFVESGNWSTLDVTAFPGEPGAYYPSANSILAALVMSCLGVSVPIALNAVNIAMVGFMFPLGMWALMIRLFGRHDMRLYVGALCSVMILAFPWEFFRRSVLLYANELGLVLLPLFMVLFMDCFEEREPLSEGWHASFNLVEGRVERIAASLVAVAAIGLAHPCAFFSAMVFAMAYVAYVLFRESREQVLWKRVSIELVWIVLCLIVWILLQQAPFLQDVVDYPYEARSGPIAGFMRVLLLWSPFVGIPYIMGLIVLIGIVASARDRRHRWILIPYAFAGVLAFVCISLPPCELKSFFSGFWYNHSARLIATVAVFAIPIATQGLSALMSAVAGFAASRRPASGGRVSPAVDESKLSRLVEVVVAVIVVLLISFAEFPLPESVSLQRYASMMKNGNDPEYQSSFLTGEERRFLEQAAQITAGDGLVVNVPHDGSGYAYGLYGMETMVRSFYPITDEDEILLAQSIDQIAADPRVSRAAENVGAEYVVRLDMPDPAMSDAPPPGASPDAPPPNPENVEGESAASTSTIYGVRFEEDDWKGIFSITDDTPGLEVVLAEGDMRLYRIVS